MNTSSTRLKRWVPYVASALISGLLHAQAVPARPQVNVTEIDTMPNWEHVVTDPCWNAGNVESLTLESPLNVKFTSPPESARLRLLWNKDFLLVRFDCHDQSIVFLPSSYGPAGQRDLPYFKADAVEAFIDPVGDGRMYMEFQFSPNGGLFDAIYLYTAAPETGKDFLLEGNFVNRNLFFIPEWNLEGLRTTSLIWSASEGKGWTVVAALPAKEILKRWGKTRFEAGMKLKANFVRFDYPSGAGHPPDITNWAPVLAGCAHVSPTGMGTLMLVNQH
jgi:hypothetical protein